MSNKRDRSLCPVAHNPDQHRPVQRQTPRLAKGRLTALVAAAVGLAAGLLQLSTTRADSGSWLGTTDATWAGANWTVATVPGVGDTATFNAAAGAGGTTIDLGAGITIDNIIFDTANAHAYNIGTAFQSLTLNDGGAITLNPTVTANQTFGADITLGIDGALATYSVTNNSPAATLTFNGNITGGSGGTQGVQTLSFAGTGTAAVNGSISNGGATSVGVNVSGLGTLILASANSYSGTTRVTNGTLNLDFTVLNTGGSDIIASGNNLNLTSGTLNVTGSDGLANSQTFGTTTLGNGLTTINAVQGAGGSLTLNLGTIPIPVPLMTVGTALRFNGPATIGALNVAVAATATITATTTTTNNGIFGNTGVNSGPNRLPTAGYATVGLYDYAAISGGIVVGGSQISGFYNQTLPTSSTSTGNYDLIANAQVAGTGANQRAMTSLRYNTPTATTFNANAGSLMTFDAILVTPNMGTSNAIFGSVGSTSSWQIARGTSPAGLQQATLWQNNTSAFFTFGNINITNGRDTGDNNIVVKAGLGTVVFGHANSYSGTLFLDEGASLFPASDNISTQTNPVDFNGGSFGATASFTNSIHPLQVEVGGGTLFALTGTTLTNSSLITGTGPLTIGYGLVAGSGPNTGNLTAMIGDGTIILSNAANTYTGGTVLAAGTLQLQGTGATLGLDGSNGIFGQGGVTFNGGTLRWTAGVVTDISSRTITAAPGGGTLDTNGNGVTLAGGIGNSGSGGFTKVGIGTLTFAGASSYTGATNINIGTVAVTGSLNSASVVNINTSATDAGTLMGTGTVGPVVLAADNGANMATLATGLPDNGYIGTLTTGALTVNGGVFQVGVGAGAGNLVVASATFNVTPTLNLLIAGNPTNGVFSILHSTAAIADNGFLSALPITTIGRLTLTPSFDAGTDPNDIFLDVNGQTGHLTWDNTGATGDGVTWDIQTSQNWLNAVTSSPDKYFEGDNVTFNDSNNGHYAVTIAGTVSPLSVVISNESGTYVFTGAGSIAGSTSLIKSGAGTATLATLNTYSGGTSVTGGTLTMGIANGLLNSGKVTVQATGTFDLAGFDQTVGALDDGGDSTGIITSSSGTPTLTINALSVNSFGGSITGSLGITKTGASTLTLSGTNTYTGLSTLTAGTLLVSSDSALGNSTAASAGLLMNPVSGTAFAKFTSASPAIASLASTGAGTSSIVLGNTTDSTATTFSVNGGGTTTTFGGVISDLSTTNAAAIGNLNVAAGTLYLSGANTFTGSTTMASGATLFISNTLALQNSTLDLTAGTALFGPSITAATVASLAGTDSSQNLTLSNTAAVPAAVALTISNGNDSTYAGGISGLGSLTKNGSGTQTLSGSVTYPGLTNINQGTLAFNGNSTLSGAISITAGRLVLGGSTSATGAIDLTAASGASALTVQDNAIVHSTAALLLSSEDPNPGTGFPGSSSILIKDSGQVIVASVSFGNGSRIPEGSFITVQDNALLQVNGTFTWENQIGGTVNHNTLNVNGGTVAVNNFNYGAGNTANATAILNLNGGAVKANVNSATFLPNQAGVTVNVLNGGAIFDDGGHNITIAANLLHDNTTLTGAIDGGLQKLGTGALTLSGSNTYTGDTTVLAGQLILTNAGDSAIGSGNVTVNSGALLGGTGYITGAAFILSGGKLAPGAGGVGTLTVGSLTLDAGSLLSFDLPTGGINDMVNISSAGLTINGGALNVAGIPDGTYTLFNYNGGLTGSVAALTTSNGLAYRTYSFDDSGSSVTLTALTPTTISQWAVDNDGNWSDPGNWSGPVPSVASAVAVFGPVISVPRVVTLDTPETVGEIDFSSGTQYSIVGASTLTLTDQATIDDQSGSHLIAVPLNVSVYSATANVENYYDNLTLSGAISGDPGLGLTKVGSGTLILSGANTYTGPTTITSGKVMLSAANNLGDPTSLTNSISLGFATLESTANNYDLGVNRAIALTAGTDSATFQLDAGTLTVSGALSGTGRLVKTGPGTLLLAGTNNSVGTTEIQQGALSISGTWPVAGNNGFIVSSLSSSNAILNILPGANITHDNIRIGGDTGTDGANGAVYQTGGSFTSPRAGDINSLALANGADSYGYYSLSGTGTINTNEFGIGGGNATGNSQGVFDISGGTLTENGWMQVVRGGSSGLLNMTGGKIVLTGNSTGTALTMSDTTTVAGTAVINIANGGILGPNIATFSLNLAETNTTGQNSIVNLLSGGVLQISRVLSNTANPVALFNFNGGTLRASGSNAHTTDFFANTNIDGAYVYGNGGTIDNNGINITLGVNLLSPAGSSGVSTFTIDDGGSGYIGAPFVTITGDGTGATAYATMTKGVVTGLVITNPGVGYTTMPTFTFSGGGPASPAFATITGLALNTSGGLNFTGSGTTTLSGANTFLGGVAVLGGTLKVATITDNVAGSLGNNTSSITLGTVGSPTAATLEYTGGSVASARNLILAASGAGAFAIDNAAANVTLSGIISGATASLLKSGPGALTLTAASTYSGATSISGGNLTLAGAGAINNSTAITVNGAGVKLVNTSSLAVAAPVTLTQGTVDGTGTFNNISVADSTSAIIANGNGGSGTLTINTLSFAGAATLNLKFGAVPSTALSTSSLTTNGTGLITINPATTALSWAAGTYDLIAAPSASTAPFTFTQPAGLIVTRQVATFGLDGGSLAMFITGSLPIWTGQATTAWTTAAVPSPKNWNAGGPTDYVTGDYVIFDDTAGATATVNAGLTAVNIADASVSPTTVLFNNNTLNYTVGGGFIATGNLIKNGTGTVTLTTNNTYTGGTTVTAGKLLLTGNETFGTGGVTVTGGTFQLGDGLTNGTIVSASSISNNATFVIQNATDEILSTPIAGAGSVLLNTATGTTVTLNGASTYSGSTTVASGTLLAGKVNSLGTSSVTVNPGATLNLNQPGSAVADITWNANAISGGGIVNVISPYSGTSTFNLPGDLSNFTGTINILPSAVTNGKAHFAGGAGLQPNSAATVFIANGTTLYLNQALTYSNIFQLGGAGNSEGLAALRLEAPTLTGSVRLLANSSIGGNGNATISGAISDSPAASGFGFTKLGSGVLTLTGVNTYTGPTTIAAGTLALNGAPNSNTTISNNITISGTATLTLLAAEQIPDSATITFTGTASSAIPTQTGAETVANIVVASTTGGTGGGQFLLNGGFTVSNLATLQSGILGVASGGTGTVNGVTITGGANSLIRVAGNTVASVFNIGSGGINTTGGEIQVKFNTSGNSATLNLGGDFTATGNASFTNGGLTSNQGLSTINLIGSGIGGAGQRVFNIAPGTTTTVAPDLAGTGGLTKTGTGTLELLSTVNSTYAGDTTVNGGVLALDAVTALPANNNVTLATGGKMILPTANSLVQVNSLNIETVAGAATSTLSLGDNDMIITTGASALQLQGWLKSGANFSGNVAQWNGLGLTTAAASSIEGIGYASVANYQLQRGTNASFDTIGDVSTLAGTSMLLKFTYLGDANLDGIISVDDYLAIDHNFNLGGTQQGWVNGDFNYDGTVNFQDYALIDAAFQQQSGTLAAGEISLHTAEFGQAYVNAFDALTTSAVPEPASLLLLGAGALGLMTRRRRHS